MRTLLLLFALAIFFSAPFAHALTLDEALQAAPNRTSVVTARTELRNAEVNLERVQGDPLAVRSDRLGAEQRFELARASFTQSYYGALEEIQGAYTGVLQARMGVQVAQKGAEVSEKAFQIAQIRVDNGSGTGLDLEEARTSLNEAKDGLRSAQDNLNIALSNLESILSQELAAEDLEGVADDYLVPIPELPRVLEVAAGHPTVLQAEQGLASAQLGSDVLDASYASQTQIEGATTGLTNAREGLRETTRGFRIQARNLYNSAVSAQETYQTQREALQNANARLRTQRQRFEGGLISQIELSQAELSNLQAELSARQARYGYLTSLLALQSGTLVDLAGPATLDAPSPDKILSQQGGAGGGAAGGSVTGGGGGAPENGSADDSVTGGASTPSFTPSTTGDTDATQTTQEGQATDTGETMDTTDENAQTNLSGVSGGAPEGTP